jgi:hypothetical protein
LKGVSLRVRALRRERVAEPDEVGRREGLGTLGGVDSGLLQDLLDPGKRTAQGRTESLAAVLERLPHEPAKKWDVPDRGAGDRVEKDERRADPGPGLERVRPQLQASSGLRPK